MTSMSTPECHKPEPDPFDSPEYQAFVESMAKHCRCSHGGPCAGVLAGGPCDEITDHPSAFDELDDWDDADYDL